MDSLEAFLAQAWECLAQGLSDRGSAARHPTLATIAATGAPTARTVVLRAVDRAQGSVDLHTDVLSTKVAELRRDPRAALHVWDDPTRLQIRLGGEMRILTGPETAPLWQKVPPASRLGYGSDPAPGEGIARADGYRRSADPARFAVLRLAIDEIELLHLGETHSRARFRRRDHWAGCWLSP